MSGAKWSKKGVETTADGSSTIYLPELDEHYHSVKGALTESQYVFVDCGLNCCRKKEVRILEVGFGTGLNAALTAMAAAGRRIEYYTVELYPLSLAEVEALGYFSMLPCDAAILLRRLHEAEWGVLSEITSEFSIRKIKCDMTGSCQEIPHCVDVVYFDAFAPEKQPAMWTNEVFCRIYEAMNDGGVFVTYCAKGEVRRRLQSVGFMVERLPGPPGGKREILRAVK